SLYAYEGTPGIADLKIDADWTDPFIWSGQRNKEHAIYKNNVEIHEEKYLTDRITEESIGFMEEEKNAPFFLWVSYNAPHTPLQAPEEYLKMHKDIQDPVKRMYAAMIHSLDDNIGELMNYLKESGLDQNTLIFFISDNGGAEYTMTTDNGRYEGGKNTEFEGGVKVPMIMKWQGVLDSGQRFQPMVSSMDIFSTSLAAANASLMPDRPIDGVNLLPFLQEAVDGEPHEYLFWQRGISKALRTIEWKLLFNDKTGDELLYNLTENKFENPDVSTTNSEIVNQLKDAHAKWRLTHAEPLWPAVIYYIAEKDGQEYFFEQ
ncbi:MAG TPA: sulfatase-like hydrolase/transferase, partial [Bacteroidales bacterium]